MSDNFGNEFAALIASAQQTFLDGIVTGKPIGVSVELIIEPAIQFGRTRADESPYYPYGYRDGDRAALARDITARTIEGIFGATTMQQTVDNIITAASAFGFAERRREIEEVEARRQREIDANVELYAEIEAAKAAVLAEADEQISVAATDAFFNAVNNLRDKAPFEIVLAHYVEPLLRVNKVKFQTTPAFRDFSNYWSRMVML